MNPTPVDLAVLGAGPCGLGLSLFAQQKGFRVQVFEAQNRAGGKMSSQLEDGFVVEKGPQGWLDREAAVRQACQLLDLKPMEAAPLASTRYVYRNGRLVALPTGPGAFFRSPMLSLPGKFRLLSEPFRKAKGDHEDESVWDFGCRRLGKEATEVLLDAVVSGIFAGNIQKLSMPAAFPLLTELEREGGSMFRGMIARRKAAKKAAAEGKPSGSGGLPMGRAKLFSFPEGMSRFGEQAQQHFGDDLRLGIGIDRMDQEDGIWHLYSGNQEVGCARQVAFTLPASATAKILRPQLPELSNTVGVFPADDMSVVSLAFPVEQTQNIPQGYGFVAARSQGLRALGIQFVHHFFPAHVPKGTALLRVMFGGSQDPQILELSDAQLLEEAHATLSNLFNIEAQAERHWVHRIAQAVPQYNLGHLARVASFEQAVNSLPGLHLAGDSFFGVGVNAAFRRAADVVDQLEAKDSITATSSPASRPEAVGSPSAGPER
ncbi:MAG: protoporphyrinogen oxidase [Planctomycetota bacterium]|nr:MAG: protoporphyrinogen oxidase [Planctomycetota bacterium]